MFNEVYATLSELLVGTAAVLTLGIMLWLSRDAKDRRFVVYLRYRATWFVRGGPDYQRQGAGNDQRSELGNQLLYSVIAAVCLGLGLAIESTIDDAIDPHPTGFRIISRPVQWAVGSKDAYRFSAFFRAERRPDQSDATVATGQQGTKLGFQPRASIWAAVLWQNSIQKCSLSESSTYELTTLGREVFLDEPELITPSLPSPLSQDPRYQNQLRLFMFSPADFLKHKALHKSAGPGPQTTAEHESELELRCEVATDLARSIYYDGNNWALRNEPTASVLRRWAVQVDTVGSLAALAVAVTISTGIFLLYRRLRAQPREKREKLNSARFWCAGGATIAIFCSYSYVVGQKGYTGRAIGMYVSAHGRGEVRQSIAQCRKLLPYAPTVPVTVVSEFKQYESDCEQAAEKRTEGTVEKASGKLTNTAPP